MKKTMLKIALAAAFAAPLPSQATIYVFKATLTADQEVRDPAVVSPALGTGTLIYDNLANTISLNMGGGGLTAPITDAHIHAAPAGINGPVILPIKDRGAPDFFGLGQTFFLADFTTSVGSGTGLFPSDRVGDLLANGTYLNVHTSAFTSGEIRGQLLLQVVAQPIPEPETYALMLAGLGLVGWVATRRRKVGV